VRIGILGTRGVPARYGGFETAAEEIGQRLTDWGHEVVVYCRNPGQTRTTYHGMTLVNLPAVRVKSLETISHTGLSIVRTISKDKPDVVFLFNAANAPYIPLLRMARIPVAVHVDGLEWQRAKWGKRASAYYKWAERSSTHWAQAVIADSVGIVDYLMAEHGAIATYIPYGAPVVTPHPDRLAALHLEPHSYHLVVARFEPENNVSEIVRGYVSSSCTMPLAVVGDSAYGDDYRTQVLRSADGDPRVRFLGSLWDQDLLDALYASAASYLHGHSVGGTNPSLLRAMGAGAPVIANAVPFNREVAGENGRYFSSPEELARECESVESNPEGARRRGEAGRVDICTRYQWDEVAASYEKLAHELLIAGRMDAEHGSGPRGRGTTRNLAGGHAHLGTRPLGVVGGTQAPMVPVHPPGRRTTLNMTTLAPADVALADTPGHAPTGAEAPLSTASVASRPLPVPTVDIRLASVGGGTQATVVDDLSAQ
jgi:glycosyltransferase involved in cell wall biosynthesis